MSRKQNSGVFEHLNQVPDAEKTSHRASGENATTHLSKDGFDVDDDSGLKPVAAIIDVIITIAGGRDALGNAFMRVTNKQSTHTDWRNGCVRIVMAQPMLGPVVDKEGTTTKAAPTALSDRNILQMKLDLTAKTGDPGVWIRVNYRGKNQLMKVVGAVLVTLEGAGSTHYINNADPLASEWAHAVLSADFNHSDSATTPCDHLTLLVDAKHKEIEAHGGLQNFWSQIIYMPAIIFV